jgi:hypothetical protein
MYKLLQGVRGWAIIHNRRSDLAVSKKVNAEVRSAYFKRCLKVVKLLVITEHNLQVT